MTVVDRLSRAIDGRLSRRSFIVRSAFAASAVATGRTRFLLRPGTAYDSLCSCGDTACGCGATCCAGYTEFCCVLDGGYNSCPSGTVMGGWWMAEGSVYCSGPRYYMDCNAICRCTSGCGGGYQFCDTGCDGLTCECAGGSCGNYLTGCFQFRYGQCNQDVTCLGRIKCRVVTCVPPWEIEPSCTTASATDDYTADQNAACLTPGPTYPQPAGPVCSSPETRCKVVGIAVSSSGKGYGMVTSFGKELPYGDENAGSTNIVLDKPISAITTCPTGGHWLTDEDGRVYQYGCPWHGSATPSAHPVVAMAATPTGNGYWLVSSIGEVSALGDAKYHGGTTAIKLAKPVVGIAAMPTGSGYWLACADGGIFSFGDARYHGGAARMKLAKPVVGIAAMPTGSGYWLVCADGGIFSFGDARYHGGAARMKLNWPVVGMAPTHTGGGYYLVAADGGVFTFGNAKFYGSPA